MKKTLRIGVAVICMVAIVVGYYYYLSHRNASVEAETQVQLSEVQSIIDKDFEKEYPATPRSVVKWYNRIIEAYYAESYSDEELEKMADHARLLLDEDLLAVNPKDRYMFALTNEIQDYKNRSRVIVSSSVCDTKEVRYEKVKGSECAYVSAYYFIREGSTYTRTYEDYCLRKDASGNWKILTWKLSDEEEK